MLRTYLVNNVPQLLLNLLLGPLETLPQIIADGAPLEQGGQAGFGATDGDYAVDVFGGSTEQGGLEDAFWHLWRVCVGLDVQEGEVYVALDVRTEPGREGCRFCYITQIN
jgi:hypothetical protein